MTDVTEAEALARRLEKHARANLAFGGGDKWDARDKGEAAAMLRSLEHERDEARKLADAAEPLIGYDPRYSDQREWLRAYAKRSWAPKKEGT